MHDPSLSHSRLRFGCFVGTFSPSRRQIRQTRLTFTSQPRDRSRAATRRAGPEPDQPQHGGVKGLEVSLSDLLQDHLIERQVRYRTPQPRILLLQILQAPGLVNLQPAILAAPTVVTLLRHAHTTTDHTHLLALRQTHFGRPKKPNNLLGCISLPAHLLILLWSSD